MSGGGGGKTLDLAKSGGKTSDLRDEVLGDKTVGEKW